MIPILGMNSFGTLYLLGLHPFADTLWEEIYHILFRGHSPPPSLLDGGISSFLGSRRGCNKALSDGLISE